MTRLLSVSPFLVSVRLLYFSENYFVNETFYLCFCCIMFLIGHKHITEIRNIVILNVIST